MLPPQSPKPPRSDALRTLLRRLSRTDRERLAARIEELDELRQLLRERPYVGRWSTRE